MPMTAEIARQNIKNGDALERRQLAKVSSSSLICCRTAGSRGLFDIWAIKDNGEIRLIQVKDTGGYVDPEERKRLKEFFLKKPSNVSIEIHVRLSKKKVHKFLIRKIEDLDKFRSPEKIDTSDSEVENEEAE